MNYKDFYQMRNNESIDISSFYPETTSPRGTWNQSILFSNEKEAKETRSTILEIMEYYDLITVADVMDLIGGHNSYSNNRLGWTKDDRLDFFLRVRNEGGVWALYFPRPKPLNESKAINKPKPCLPRIKDVIFSEPATIVFWEDGTKTVVKAQNGEKFDQEKGLAMAIVKKAYGNKSSYNNVIHKYVDPHQEQFILNNDRIADLKINSNFIVKINEYLKSGQIQFDEAPDFNPVYMSRTIYFTAPKELFNDELRYASIASSEIMLEIPAKDYPHYGEKLSEDCSQWTCQISPTKNGEDCDWREIRLPIVICLQLMELVPDCYKK